MKKKILIWCDAPILATGFAEVANNLFSELHKEYEVDIVGINYFGLQKYDHEKWNHIYPVQTQNFLGTDVLGEVLKHNKYDKFILFQDIFHIVEVLKKFGPILTGTKVYTYFPIDGGPLDQSWETLLENKDIVNITYTKYAIETIKESYPNLDTSKLKYLYHGVSPEFELLPSQKRKGFKRDFLGENANNFLAVMVNKYQPRKNLSALLRVWSMFSKGYKMCKCGNAYPLHLNYCDANRCDASQIIDTYPGKDDVSLYLHTNLHSRSNGPGVANRLQSVALRAGFVDENLSSKKLMMASEDLYSNKPYSTAEMNSLYNAADINLSTAIGEGVGLSLIEAAMTGTTSIAPRNSAIIEMLEGHGILVDNVPNGIMTFGYDNSFRRPNVDTYKYLQALEDQYQEWIKNGRKKVVNTAAIEIAKEKFRWEDKREFIHDILENS